jgi:ACR3 family arsenite transporter
MTTEVAAPAPESPPAVPPKRLKVFERYLSLWVALCMAAGVGLGRLVPEWIDRLRKLEFGSGSQINVPIAVLIWLMIMPMMMKIDFTSQRRSPRCLDRGQQLLRVGGGDGHRPL